MLGALLLVAMAWAAGQGETAEPRAVPTCTLIAPNGDSIGFKVLRWDSAGRAFGLVATEGSVWPARTIVGARPRPDREVFAFGGEHGLLVQIAEREGEVQPAAIYRREGERVGLPVAHGFCRQEAPFTVFAPLDPTADPEAIGDDIAAFDPQRWPADSCALLLDDGRRFDLRYRLNGERAAEFANAELWPDGRVRANLQRGRSRGGVGQARFSRRGGPSGMELFHVARDRSGAVKLLQLDEVGGTAAGRTGYGICGYNRIERRPRVQAG